MIDIHAASFATPEQALRAYDRLVGPARQRFAASRGISTMVSPDTDPRMMAAFLLHFSALSVPITEPVEGWIRCAAQRCEALGLVEIARALKVTQRPKRAITNTTTRTSST